MFSKKIKCAVCEKPLEGKESTVYVVLDGMTKDHTPIPTCSLECAQTKKSEDIKILTKRLSAIIMQELSGVPLEKFAKGEIPTVSTKSKNKPSAGQTKTLAPAPAANANGAGKAPVSSGGGAPAVDPPPLKNIALHAHGFCLPDKPIGGWGFALKYGEKTLERSGGNPNTTSSRMELTAVLEGLKQLKVPCRVTVVTDSTYVAKGAEKILSDKGSKDLAKPAIDEPNDDLWQAFLLAGTKHNITVKHIKNPAREAANEKCLQMAMFEAENTEALSVAATDNQQS